MKILCVGQNYAKHVAEVPGNPSGQRPTWFWKPETAIVRPPQPIRIPTDIGAIHHEVELAVRIGPDGKPDAFSVALDVTARDMQNEDKKAGRPWQQAKGYDTFLPLGYWVDAEGIDLQNLQLRLLVNEDVRQDGTTADMTWSIDELLSEAAQWTTLKAGDIVLTGTPHGVAELKLGDQVNAAIIDHVEAIWKVAAR